MRDAANGKNRFRRLMAGLEVHENAILNPQFVIAPIWQGLFYRVFAPDSFFYHE